MRLVAIDAVRPGMRLALAVYNQRGGLLLRTGTLLSESYLELLRRCRVAVVWIAEAETAEVVVHDALPERTRAQATQQLGSLFDGLRESLNEAKSSDLTALARYLQSSAFMEAMTKLGAWDLYALTSQLVEESVDADPASSPFGISKLPGSYLLGHGVDTAVLAVTLGARLKLDRQSLRQIAQGCLLHDIGMVMIDERLRRKPDRLTNEERSQVEQHTVLGYAVLSRVSRDAVLANHVAYQHHERQDGTGYPRRLRGDNVVRRDGVGPGSGRMTFLAEVAAVADVYDAVTTDRPYRPALPPDLALVMLQRMAGSWLNAGVVREFLRLVPPFPLATEVVVKEGPARGYSGIVCKVNPDYLDRPVIRMLANGRGEPVRPFDLDLRRMPTVEIRAVSSVARVGEADSEPELVDAVGK